MGDRRVPHLPNAASHNPDPNYLRELIAQSGLSISEAARRIGVGKSNFKQMLDSSHSMQAPYAVQFCLEVLAQNKGEYPPL
jgi:predicted DNA-binding protein (UPF0251 family)